MSVIISTTVEGISTPVLVNAEYSSIGVGDLYKTYITKIASIYNAIGVSTTDNPTNFRNPTVQDALDIQSSLASLLDLAQNGVVDPAGSPVTIPDPNNPGQTITVNKFFLTIEMAQAVDLIKKSLNAVGFDTAVQSGDSTSIINALKRWKDLNDVGLFTIVQNAVNAVNTNRSLQAMVELEYVKAGNDQINSALLSLKDALTITKDALSVLQNVQDLHNKVNIVPVDASAISGFTSGNPVTINGGSFASNQFSSINQYSDQYKSVADGLFDDPLTVVGDNNPTTPVPAGGTGDAFSQETLNAYTSVKARLAQVIARLKAVDPTNSASPDSLASKMQLVLDDMQNKTMNQWVNDSLDSTDNANSGNIQQHITNAITAGESLNDQQKESVRQQMFIFEEFYKSAGSILSAISQIIVKMAQGIAR